MLDYRADIDGLRALAIVPVVLFHAELAGFTGGFVGVDVFFVISGFLITSLIIKETAEQRFSYWGFLERRARRLIPAFIPVLIAVWIGGYFMLLLPGDFENLSQSITYLWILIANHFFLSNSNYFQAGDAAPLLHSWSLSVEEQFYLIYALIMLAVLRYARRWLIYLLAAGLLISLAISHYLVETARADEAFFLALPRFWELLIGAVLAAARLPAPVAPLSALCRIAGLGLIVYAALAFDSATAFPGLNALIPTLGAALIIYSGIGRTAEQQAGDPVYRLLVLPPVVYLGKISYALYLWHWPLLVYAGLVAHMLPFWHKLAVVAVSVGLAALSFHLIETPFRRRRWLPARRQVFTATLAAGTLFMSLGGLADHLDGVPQRLDQNLRELIDYDRHYRDPRPEVACSPFPDDGIGEICKIGDQTREGIDFAVWGDSHGLVARMAYEELARARGLRGVLFYYPACPPILGAEAVNSARPNCAKANQAALNYIENHAIGAVFLQGIWTAYTSNIPLGFDEDILANAGELVPISDRVDRQIQIVLGPGLATTVGELSGPQRRVWLVEPVPTYKVSVPARVALVQRYSLPLDTIAQPRAHYIKETAHVRAAFEKLARQSQLVGRIALVDGLCPADTCLVVDDAGRILYRDNNHLTDDGTTLIKPALAPAFDEIAR